MNIDYICEPEFEGYQPHAQAALSPQCIEIKADLKAAMEGADPSVSCQKYIEAFNTGSLERGNMRRLGWLIYYALRHTPPTAVMPRKRLLAQYLRLDIPRPSGLHSLILSEAVKTERNAPVKFRFRDFIKLWGIDNLQEADWEQRVTEDGKIMPSLVEKMIGAYSRDVKAEKGAVDADISAIIDTALERFPNNPNMPYFKAACLMAQGHRAEALEYYKKLLLKYPTKYYLWDQASALVDDLDTRIALLCRAVSMGDDDGYLGAARLRLADALIDKGLANNAKTELDRYRSTYAARGWGIKHEFRVTAYRIPLDTPGADNARLYESYAPAADKFLLDSLPEIDVVKVGDKMADDRYHPGRRYRLWTLKGPSRLYYLKNPRKYGLDPQTQNGANLLIKEVEGKVVWIRPA